MKRFAPPRPTGRQDSARSPRRGPSDHDMHEAERLTGLVIGTIVAAGVLTVSWAENRPQALEAGIYMTATVVVIWLAHGWAFSLGRRTLGSPDGLIAGLRHELPVLEAVVVPILALIVVDLLGESDRTAIAIAAWSCVGELGLLGASIARDEGRPFGRMILTGVACAGLGLTMIVLKAFVH